MTIALLFSLETCIVQTQSVRVNFASTKRLLSLWTEDHNARLCARCAIFLLKIKQILFSCQLVKGFTFLKRVQSQFKMLLKMCFVPATILKTENCESFGGYPTTPRSIYGCGKCGAWLFVHKVPFMLQGHVKTTKTDKTHFFFAKKGWICHPTNSCSLRSLLGTIPHQSQSTAVKKVEMSPNNE